MLGALILALAAWMALSLGSARAERRAFNVAFAGGNPADAQIQAALADARRARRLNADAGPRLLEWRLLARSGERERALTVLRGVARSEPENYEAWVYLAQTAGDASVERRARRQLRVLRPPP